VRSLRALCTRAGLLDAADAAGAEAKAPGHAAIELVAQMVLRRREAAGTHLLLLYARDRRGGVFVCSPLQRTFRRGGRSVDGCKERGLRRAYALHDNVVAFNLIYCKH
jgi:hypothetical protein